MLTNNGACVCLFFKNSLHFVDKTPSPTSKFEFSSLPFINQAPPFLGSAEHAQVPPHYPDYHSGGGYIADNFSLRRLPSFSDCSEEMMSFSSLPTSHFTLRPSSSDINLDESPSQFWNQSTFGYRPADSESWNWNQAGSERTHWLRKASIESISGSSRFSAPSYPNSAPSSNYGSNLTHNAHSSNNIGHNSSTQQVGSQEKSAQPSRKDVSRSSLSVTDSKTIVLTNSPTPWHLAGNKKKEAGKLLSQQQQNHRLVNSTSLPKARKSPPHTGERKEGSGEKTKRPSQEIARGDIKVNGTVSDVKPEGSVTSEGSMDSDGNSERGEGGGESVTKKGVTTAGTQSEKATKEAKDAANKGQAQSKTDQALKAGSPATSAAATGEGASQPSTGGGDGETVGTKAVQNDGGASSKEQKQVVKKPPKIVDVWSMRGPANGILSLNARGGAKKKPRLNMPDVMDASLESAVLITSQFVAKTAKKSDGGSGLTSDLLPPPLGGILIRNSSANRSGSNTPTILGSADVPTQQKLLSLGGIGAMKVTGLGSVGKLSEPLPPVTSSSNSSSTALLQQHLQDNVIAVSQGGEVKRANSISDGVGSGSHVTISQPSTSVAHHPTASAGTNGTNFFNSTKRKLSENTERGLKQALAGYAGQKFT